MEDFEVVLDFDGVMVNSFLYYLSHPLKTFNILTKALANCIRERNVGPSNLIRNFLIRSGDCAKKIGKEMVRYKSKGLADLFHFLEKEKIGVKIVSSSPRELVSNFLEEFKKIENVQLDYQLIATSPHKFISRYDKANSFGNEKIISVTDCEIDIELSKKSYLSFIRKTVLWYISRRKPTGYSIKNLSEFLHFLKNYRKKIK